MKIRSEVFGSNGTITRRYEYVIHDANSEILAAYKENGKWVINDPEKALEIACSTIKQKEMQNSNWKRYTTKDYIVFGIIIITGLATLLGAVYVVISLF